MLSEVEALSLWLNPYEILKDSRTYRLPDYKERTNVNDKAKF